VRDIFIDFASFYEEDRVLSRHMISEWTRNMHDPDDADELWKKIGKVAKSIYHASEVVADTAVRKKIEKFQEDGFGNLPICIAKTQYSFSTDPQLRGAPTGHVFNVRDVYLNAGAGFMVVLSGEIMTMPGLPKKPASDNIDIDADGNIVGLA
jgi:formate--tetrahydrofolate ligase